MRPVHHLSDEERFPALTDEGRKFLRDLREHPNAPKYNYECGDQLSSEGLAQVRAYETALQTDKKAWRLGEVPQWVLNFALECYRDVPFYRRRLEKVDDFFAIPTCSRKDIEKEPWSFVPDSQALDDLIIYYTSG